MAGAIRKHITAAIAQSLLLVLCFMTLCAQAAPQQGDESAAGKNAAVSETSAVSTGSPAGKPAAVSTGVSAGKSAVSTKASVGESEAPTVSIVAGTYEDALFISSLASACHVDAVIEESGSYVPAVGSRLITNVPEAARKAIAAGIRPMCIGEGFQDSGEITFGRPVSASVGMVYGSQSESPVFKEDFSYIESTSGKTKGTVEISGIGERPFAAICSSAVYVPCYNESGLSAFVLSSVIGDYCEKHEKAGLFAVMDEVYPFSDLESLRESGELLSSSGIPFIVRIMPIYDNLEYPAFLRYTDTLRYLQSIGGTVVIHNFIERPTEIVRETAEERLERFTNALTDENVRFFPMPYEPITAGIEELERIQSDKKNMGQFPVDIMVSIPVIKDADEREFLIRRINNRWLSFDDYRLRYTTDKYTYEKREISGDYDYMPVQEGVLAEFFAAGNNVIMVIMLISIAIFGILIIIGSRLYRRKFFK